MEEKICLITGVGPGTGTALVRKFAREGYRVAMISRTRERLEALESELPDVKGFACDVADSVGLESTFVEIENQIGQPQVLVHNAVGAERGTYMEIDPEKFLKAFQVLSLIHI